jgi:hypothetical protein
MIQSYAHIVYLGDDPVLLILYCIYLHQSFSYSMCPSDDPVLPLLRTLEMVQPSSDVQYTREYHVLPHLAYLGDGPALLTSTLGMTKSTSYVLWRCPVIFVCILAGINPLHTYFQSFHMYKHLGNGPILYILYVPWI